MKVGIKLFSKGGFPWLRGNTCFSKGYMYHQGKILEGTELNAYISNVKSREELHGVLKQVNGIFSFLLKIDDNWYLVQDIIRSFPLFFMKNGEEWEVSDDANYLKGLRENMMLNEPASLEFLGTGYVTGKETLLKDIYQVQAGEMVLLGKEVAEGHFYFTYRTGIRRNGSYLERLGESSRVLHAVSERMVSGLKNRPVVLPLSAGFDSRLIACMLKKAGCENVLCFTYGRKNGPEVKRSEQVANILGFRWMFIEYTNELIRDFVSTEEFTQYYPRGAGLTSMFFLQEYFAVKYLKEVVKIPGDALFIPGHSGDFLGGSQFLKHNFTSLNEPERKLVNRLFKVKYGYKKYDRNQSSAMKKRILMSLQEKETGNKDFAYAIHEDWDMKEKLAKFNNNSTSIYTNFSYEFRSPFWDREIVEFFRDLELEYKLNKKLYDDILTKDYFQPLGVKFDEELQDTYRTTLLTRFKGKIKPFLPPRLIDRFEKKDDLLFYHEITAELLKDLRKEGKDIGFYGNKFNKVIIGWYLEDLKKKISLQNTQSDFQS